MPRFHQCGSLSLRHGAAAVSAAFSFICLAVPPAASAAEEAVTRDVSPVGAAGAEHRVTLEAILSFADSNSPLLSVPLSRLAYGDAALRGAKPLLPDNPELSLGLGPRFAAGAAGFELEVSLEQRFEIAGERRLRLEAARLMGVRLEHELDAARRRVHLTVHAAYHAALIARERTIAASEALAFAERIVEVARRRLAAGDVSPLAVRVAEGELAQAKQVKLEADGAYLLARLRLAEVAGWPPGTPPEPASTLDEPKAPPPLERLLALALEHHPSLRILEATIAEREARVTLADREAWPEPFLGIGFGHESDPGGMAPAGANIALLTLGVAWPVWRRNDAERAFARADVAVVRSEADATRRLLETRIARAARAVEIHAERVAAWGTEILPTFEKNLELLRTSFELGEIDIVQVLVVQERFLALQRDALGAYAAYYTAVAVLELELGTEIWADTHEEASE